MKMKKNASEKEEKKDSSSKYFIVIVAVIIVLFFAIFLGMKIAQKNSIDEKTVTYNNYLFKQLEDNIWYVDLSIKGKPYNIPFYYTPDQVDYVEIENESVFAIGWFNKMNPGGKIYIAIDPNESSKIVIAGVEVARLLGKNYDIYNFNVESAFFRIPYENYSDRPIVTCENASSKSMVIMLAVGNKDRVRSIGNCILLESMDLNNSVKVADAYAYKLLRIIP